MSLPISSSNLHKPTPTLHPKEGFKKPASQNLMSQSHLQPQPLAQSTVENQKRPTSYPTTEEELTQQLKKQKIDQTPSEKFGNLADTLFSFYNTSGNAKKQDVPMNSPSTNIYYKLVPVELPADAINSQKTYISSSISSGQDQHCLFISPEKPMVNINRNGEKILQAVNLKDLQRSPDTSTSLANLVLDVRNLASSKEGDALKSSDLYSEMGKRKKKSHLHERLEVMMKSNNSNILDKLKKGPNTANKPIKKPNKQNEASVQKRQLEDRFMEMLGKTQSLLEATQNVILKVSGGLAKDKQDTKHQEESQNKLRMVNGEEILNLKPMEVSSKPLQIAEQQPVSKKIIAEKASVQQTGEIVVKDEPENTQQTLIIPPLKLNYLTQPTFKSISDLIQSDQGKI